VDTDGFTPLHHAAARCQIGVAKILLAHKADVNVDNGRMPPPVFLVILRIPPPSQPDGQRPFEMLKLLLDNGADLTKTSGGETPLKIATRNSSQLADMLRQYGAKE